ncbi:hypothetical protein TgHK011_000810 [Trichoderma gracile]|nr:hypothetical protein TgHK011_000810 [Trichoderma gracile]
MSCRPPPELNTIDICICPHHQAARLEIEDASHKTSAYFHSSGILGRNKKHFAALTGHHLTAVIGAVRRRLRFIPCSVSQALGSSIEPFKSNAPAQAQATEGAMLLSSDGAVLPHKRNAPRSPPDRQSLFGGLKPPNQLISIQSNPGLSTAVRGNTSSHQWQCGQCSLSDIDPPGHSNCKQPLERIPSSFAALRILTFVLAAGRWSYFPPPRTRRAINPSTSAAGAAGAGAGAGAAAAAAGSCSLRRWLIPDRRAEANAEKIQRRLTSPLPSSCSGLAAHQSNNLPAPGRIASHRIAISSLLSLRLRISPPSLLTG